MTGLCRTSEHVTDTTPPDRWHGSSAAVAPASVSSVIHAYRAWIERMPAPPRLLVVDDDASISRFVDRVLLDAGYQTAVAHDGSHARELAAGAPFDLLVTDLVMPGLPGDELAQELRQRFPQLRVLYLTGYADRLFVQRGQLREGEA